MNESRLNLNQQFEEDMYEAYTYWVQKTTPNGEAPWSFERWVREVLKKPVYELIAAKRAEAE
jgi:hypothetical protein